MSAGLEPAGDGAVGDVRAVERAFEVDLADDFVGFRLRGLHRVAGSHYAQHTPTARHDPFTRVA